MPSLLKPMSLPAYVGLVLEGLRSNFWGLGCPAFCVQPSFGLLLATFLVGWILGVACTIFPVLWVCGVLPLPSWDRAPAHPSRTSHPPPSSGADLLASYLHGARASASRRG